MAKKKIKPTVTVQKKSKIKAKILCAGKISDGSPCIKTVEKKGTFCIWHNSEDETWGQIYAYLERTPPEQKRNIVQSFIESHPEHRLDLRLWNGQAADLSGVDLSNVELQNAYLLKVNLQDAILQNANLRGALLVSANLKDVYLENTDLRETNLMNAILEGCNLKSANLEDANLREANIQGAHFDKANCIRTNFSGADLEYADFQDANLQEAILTYSNLQNARLNQARLIGAHLDRANLQKANLGGANVSHAYLYAAKMQGAYLWLTSFRGAHLDGANLQECDIMHTDFQDVSFVNSKLQGVDLTNAQSLLNIYLKDAWLDRTRLRKEQLGDAIGEEQQGNYSDAKLSYLALKQNFDDLGDYEASSWAYRKERKMEKFEARESGKAALEKRERRLPKLTEGEKVYMERNLKDAFAGYSKYISDTFVEWLCDYGESVWRVIGWIAFMLFAIGPLLFSGLGGVVWSKDLTHEYWTLSLLNKIYFLYKHYFLYTLDVFTTASFSGLQPINNVVKFFSGLFAIGGITLAGLLGFVAGNRIRRS